VTPPRQDPESGAHRIGALGAESPPAPNSISGLLVSDATVSATLVASAKVSGAERLAASSWVTITAAFSLASISLRRSKRDRPRYTDAATHSTTAKVTVESFVPTDTRREDLDTKAGSRYGNDRACL